MKLYVSRRGQGVEKAKEIPEIDIVEIYTNIDGIMIIDARTKDNRSYTYDAKRYNFWIVHTTE